MNMQIFVLLLLYIYICVKNIAIFYAKFTKQIFIFSLLTPQFFIHKHPACKRNRNEQGITGWKIEVLQEHTF